MTPDIRDISAEDIPAIVSAFADQGWARPASTFQRYLSEQAKGERTAKSCWIRNDFAGYVTIAWSPRYPPFRVQAIPEIADLNVLIKYRGLGLGRSLVQAAERIIAARSARAGIGVGMTRDYGIAQKLYARMGYIPDGQGLAYDAQALEYGQTVRLDDDLVLYLVKDLIAEE